MDDIAIKVDNVSKTFKLPHEKSGSIKSLMIHPFKRKKGYELQKALNDVSFEVKKGEFFGIVGRNGSGKSTLLKMLAGIYTPTKGNIQVNGKLTPFIELGVGFNPELTGRENVYLNGALLGFNRKEMNAMYKDIVEFAELEKFMDQKLKNYSSGMQVRLAFSIAIRAKSDILLIDEVLAVGDEAFQRKCLDIFEEYKRLGKTVIFVSHDMSSVTRFCTQALLLNDGTIVKDGDPNKVASGYSMLTQQNIDKDIKESNNKLDTSQGLKLSILDEKRRSKTTFEHNETCVLKVVWPPNLNVKNVGVAITTGSGQVILGTNTLKKELLFKNQAVLKVKLNLLPGKYGVVGGVFGETKIDILGFESNGPKFMIRGSSNSGLEGITELDHRWSVV